MSELTKFEIPKNPKLIEAPANASPNKRTYK